LGAESVWVTASGGGGAAGVSSGAGVATVALTLAPHPGR
jgi:hypothetical protein